MQDIPAECYGGEETLLSYDTFTRTRLPRNFEKTRNAYMLIYQRKVPQPVGSSPKDVDANAGATAVAVSAQAEPAQQEPKDRGCSKLLEHVWKDNVRFLHEKKLFDPAYFSFLWHLIDLNSDSSLPGTPTTPSCRVSVVCRVPCITRVRVSCVCRASRVCVCVLLLIKGYFFVGRSQRLIAADPPSGDLLLPGGDLARQGPGNPPQIWRSTAPTVPTPSPSCSATGGVGHKSGI